MRRKFEAITAMIMIILAVGLIYYQIVKPHPSNGDAIASSRIIYQYDGISEDTDGDWEDDEDLQ